ncbi:phenylacetate--CoA ligase family protein [Candidatus Methanoperedens nitratireducens]|nr:hypothetical protein [Candidatus Methanoperedens nitroreducens]
MFNDISELFRFYSDLYRFLGEKITLEESMGIIAQRLKKRDEMFLEFIKEKIYEKEDSPYLKLMKTTGLEFKDIESFVADRGIEGTLKELAERGVYLTIDEFKGRSVCKRNGHTFSFREEDFNNITSAAGIRGATGGTRSQGTPVFFNFDYIREKSVLRKILLDAFDILDYPCVVWFPDGLGLSVTLEISKLGKPPLKWFYPINRAIQKKSNWFSSFKYWLMIESIAATTNMRGVHLPRPEYIDFEDSIKVAKYLSEIIEKHGGCYVITYPSSALKACRAAKEKGLRIAGTWFLLGGEPFTDLKKKEMESVGAKGVGFYISTESGPISLTCSNPGEIDDSHLLDGHIAVIQKREEVKFSNLTVDAFLLTSFLPDGPKTLLNVEMGDFGVIEKRSCGCRLEKLGLLEHIHTIRSFEKMTGIRMSMLNNGLLRIVEEILPRRFGGSVTDYQIVEVEGDGFTELNLLISPNIAGVNKEKVLETMLDELRAIGKNCNLSIDMLENVKNIRIKREYSKRTRVGKVFSFHVEPANR